MRQLDLWNLKSRVYGFGRSLPLVRRILNAEKQNLQSLFSGIPVPPNRTLDIGSGAGSTLDILPEGLSRICMDRSLGMVKRLNQSCRMVVRADALAIPFREQSFPFVSLVGVTEYIGQKEKLADEIKRVLFPEGMFLCTISPPGILNTFRNMLGNRIYPMSGRAWEFLLSSKGFSLIGKRKSLVQIQYLFKA